VRALLRRAVGNLPPGVQKIRTRWDGGYFAADLAHECIELDAGFAIGCKRNRPMISAATTVPDQAWVPAVGMEHTEIAVIGYLPGTWPKVNQYGQKVVCVARRTRIPVEHLSQDPRSRKRRTVPKDQLALALESKIEAVYGYSFFLTDQDTSTDEALAMLEWWYRHRTDIEALNRDAKHGADLLHMPSADRAINTVWMWGALLACAMPAWLQEITGIDRGNGRGRATIASLRHQLICVPARVIRHAGQLTLRPPPGDRHRLLDLVLTRLYALPAPA
jgi:Transposase DDE domain group 1